MNEWIDFELKEATTKIGSGATPRGGQEAYKEEGISLIRSQNILDFSFSYNGLAFIDDEQADKLKNVTVEEEDVLINITGDSVARVTKVPTEVLPARVNQHVAILRADKNKLDPDYLLYYLLNPAFKRHLLRIASHGATRNALTKTDLEELIINAPKKVEDQKEVAKLLSIYDKKITLLRQQNQTLEELAQTLFKRWFVEFEFPCLPSDYRPQGQVNLSEMAKVCTYQRVGGLPAPDGNNWFIYVLLCEDGSFYKGMTNDIYRRFYEHYTGQGAKHTKAHKPKKVIHWEKFDTQDQARKREEELKSGYGRTWIQRQWEKVQGGLPTPECQLRMAGKMVDSELGEIPEGWQLGTIEDLTIRMSSGGTPSTKNEEYYNGSINWFSTKELQDNFLLESEKQITLNAIENSSAKLFPKNTILMAIYAAPTVGRLGILSFESAFNQAAVGLVAKSEVGYPFVFLLLKHLRKELNNLANGAAQQNLNVGLVKGFKIIIPAGNILSHFNELALSLFNQIQNNSTEMHTLSLLRDTLLPKLMSGELKLKELA